MEPKTLAASGAERRNSTYSLAVKSVTKAMEAAPDIPRWVIKRNECATSRLRKDQKPVQRAKTIRRKSDIPVKSDQMTFLSIPWAKVRMLRLKPIRNTTDAIAPFSIYLAKGS